jgi:hypothetical protein
MRINPYSSPLAHDNSDSGRRTSAVRRVSLLLISTSVVVSVMLLVLIPSDNSPKPWLDVLVIVSAGWITLGVPYGTFLALVLVVTHEGKKSTGELTWCIVLLLAWAGILASYALF